MCILVLLELSQAVIHQRQPLHQFQKQNSYFLLTQNYVAVPGTIIDHFNEAPETEESYSGSPLSPMIVSTPNMRPSGFEVDSESSIGGLPPDNDEDNSNPSSPQPSEPKPPATSPQPPSESEYLPQPPPSGGHHHHPHLKVHKHISVHVAPKEMEDDSQVTVIRPKLPPPDKHVNFIFIKAPSLSTSQKTEIILPQEAARKTLIYILIKKSQPTSNPVRVLRPAPTEPPKPQVFFVKYKEKIEGPGFTQERNNYNTFYHSSF